MSRNGSGPRVSVPDHVEQERQAAGKQAMARAQAGAAFHGTIVNTAAQITSGLVAGLDLVTVDHIRMDSIARFSVDLARRLVILAHKCEFPTMAEMEPDEAEEKTSGQEG